MDGSTQIVSISPNGDLSTVLRKRGKGLDLRDVGGEFDARRVSDIEWSKSLNGFTIMLKTKLGEQPLTVSLLHVAGLEYAGVCEVVQTAHSYNEVLAFDDYEDAVTIEVMYLDAAKANNTSIVKWH